MYKFLTCFILLLFQFISPNLLKAQQLKSVLSEGEWFKIAVNGNGLFKLSYAYLKSIGFPVSDLRSDQLHVYGNSTGLLPIANSVSRPDDLLQNSLLMQDGGDGIFNEGDYVLFYAAGPDKITYNLARGMYVHEKHKFDEQAYFFVTRSAVPSLLINPKSSTVDLSQLVNVNSFVDVKYHEINLENLAKSGREMYGEKFDFKTNYAFTFDFPNILNTEQVKFMFDGASSCPNAGNSIQFRVNDQVVNTLNITSIPGQYTPANGLNRFFTFTPSSDLLNVSLVFNKAAPDNKAWINYLVLNAIRNLKYSSNSLLFRAPINVTNPNFNYVIANANAGIRVLDITDATKPSFVQGQLVGGNYEFKSNGLEQKVFYAFSGDNFPSPTFVEKIANQNLHQLQNVNMVIVSHKNFLEAANRLALQHIKEGLQVSVVEVQQIYNEFSSGAVDPTAIKDFMRMLYKRGGSVPRTGLKYLLLFGDGSYDTRNFEGNTNFLPTFQSANSLSETSSYVTDDYFGWLDDHEAENFSDNVDIGIGRLPVKTLAEANAMVDKIERYLSVGYQLNQESPFGSWRNKVVFVADDASGDPGSNREPYHQQQANIIAEGLESTYPDYRVEKIYSDAFKQISTPGGQRYPDVNSAIKNAVQRGALIVNYTGHGGEVGWAHERILDVPTINAWTNKYAMPLFVTATCEFSRFDDPNRTSAGEYVLLNPKGGGIALLTTTRLVYSTPNFILNRDFYNYALPDSNGNSYTLGELNMFIKRNAAQNNGDNHLNFTLLGDPALKLSYPKYKVYTDSVNGKLISENSDTLKAFSKVKISGFVGSGQGGKIATYSGVLTASVYDKKDTVLTLNNDSPDNPKLAFTLRNKLVYKGNVSVEKGEFTIEFIVPKDISLSVGDAYISYYAQNGTDDALGSYDKLPIGSVSDELLNDDKGPEVSLFMNASNFRSGDVTDENPSLFALVRDESGINTTGNGIGHDIVAVLDENTDQAVVLNEFYQSDLNSYQTGSILYPFQELSEGEHTLSIKVWDINNNSASSRTSFVVVKAGSLLMQNVLNFPNPMIDNTNFSFEHNQSGQDLLVQISIFDGYGKEVKRINEKIYASSYKVDTVKWDGTSNSGGNIIPGVYVYKLSVTNEAGKEITKSSKLMVVK